MGFIKEPFGIDLIISPMPYLLEDCEFISQIIAQYKISGEIPMLQPKASLSKKKKKNESSPRNLKKLPSSNKTNYSAI